MSYKIIALLFQLLLISCGQKPIDTSVQPYFRPVYQDDPIFAEYKNRFEAMAKNELKVSEFEIGDIPIVLTDNVLLNKTNVIGVCYEYSDGKKAIEIKREFWDRSHDFDRQVLINHELGHCRLNRDHNDSVHEGVKLSVMHSEAVYGTLYDHYRSFYDTELFSNNVEEFRKYLLTL